MPLIPSQQSSLRATRTALVCQEAMAATEVASLGPSKIPKPSTHAYSGPERLTPRRRTGLPAPSTSWLPCTFTATVAAEAGRSTSTAPRAARASASARARARATPPLRRDLYRRAATGFSPRLYRWGSSPLQHPGSRGGARVGGRDGRYSRALSSSRLEDPGGTPVRIFGRLAAAVPAVACA